MRNYSGATALVSAIAVWSAGCGPAGDAHVERSAATVQRVCVDCHNDVERSGGLSLEDVDLRNVAERGELWETVLHKLRGRMMPPAGPNLPEVATTDDLADYLESELDKAAAAEPNPGRKSLHRLNRTEYANAVRDLLGLEIDAEALLPSDSAAYGFDNIADVLGTDPSLMDRYLSAAWKITSAAIGDTSIPPTASSYRVPADRSQHEHIEGLPLGTRGGMLVEHYFPVDGTYRIRPKLWRNTVDVVRGTETPHELEVSLDGARLALTRFGGPEDEQKIQSLPGAAGDELMRRLELTIDVSAGMHEVGVAFAKKSSATRQEVLQPFLREKHDPRMDVGIPELAEVVIEGPLEVKGPGESRSRRRIFTCYPERDSEAAACAESILTRIARRAYRRPLTDEELDRLMSLYAGEREQGRSFEDGIQTALAYILVAPQFLFRVEEDPEGLAPGEVYRISDLEMATRLSFFLWSTVPDDELIDLAVEGRLQEPEVLEGQVRRMLADERAEVLAKDFASQWLYLRNLRATAPDMFVFPDFDDNLRESMMRETELLFATIVREDRPVPELLSADFTYVNERLARHYGIPGVYGDQFRRIEVTDERRKGLLGHASILTLTSYPNRTSPVNRGAYVLTNILGTPPPEPPPDIPGLPESTDEQLTMREQMARHRADTACSGCHALMDPIGLALERYDGIGRWRDHQAGIPIDSKAGIVHVLRDFGPIDGPVQLREAILSEPERFVHAAAEKLLIYALGRGLEHYDMPVVREIVREAAEQDYRFSALVMAIVESEPFQMRVAGGAEAQPDAVAQQIDSEDGTGRSAAASSNPFTGFR